MSPPHQKSCFLLIPQHFPIRHQTCSRTISLPSLGGADISPVRGAQANHRKPWHAIGVHGSAAQTQHMASRLPGSVDNQLWAAVQPQVGICGHSRSSNRGHQTGVSVCFTTETLPHKPQRQGFVLVANAPRVSLQGRLYHVCDCHGGLLTVGRLLPASRFLAFCLINPALCQLSFSSLMSPHHLPLVINTLLPLQSGPTYSGLCTCSIPRPVPALSISLPWSLCLKPT